MTWDQLLLACLGVPAAFLAGSPNFNTRRWAYVFGLAAQPFWFYTSYTHQQWGIVALCFIYATAWGRGFYAHWLRKAHHETLPAPDNHR